MNKIRKGDKVVVIAGKDKGKRGTVLSIVKPDKVLIEGVNVVKKHQKPMPAKGISAGIIEKALPIHISNVALVNPMTNKQEKVGFKMLENGRKVRIYKATGEVVELG
jgi:large subunit ribosomal protein L24